MTLLSRGTVLRACAVLLGASAAWWTAQAAEPASAPVAGVTRSVEQGPRWQVLKPAEQQALSPLQKEWAGIGAERKKKWLEVAARLPSLSQGERERIQERMAEWARLSPEERGRARLQFQEVRQLSPQDRQERWEAYRALPEDQKKALAAKASSAPQGASSASGRPVAAVQDPRAAAPGTKQNRVNPSPGPTLVKAVEPTVVHAKPGATTPLVARPASPPAHHQPGQPAQRAAPAQPSAAR